MKYINVIKGAFIERPNRFIAKVNIDSMEEIVHVKNTGRCKELLIKGCNVYLSVSDNPLRKTRCDLICSEKMTDKGKILINLDSQAPNDVAAEWLPLSGLFSKEAIFKREYTYKKSRFDFHIADGNRKIFLEVKGVTLENDGIVSFPDAPTERGVKHLNELASAIDDGYEAYILFVIQMKGAKYFTSNDINHKEFGDTLKKVRDAGVKVIAMDCIVTPDEIYIDKEVPVII